MNRHGFEKVYLDSLIKSIFIYTGKTQKLINYFNFCRSDLIIAEKTRKIKIFKKFYKVIYTGIYFKTDKKI